MGLLRDTVRLARRPPSGVPRAGAPAVGPGAVARPPVTPSVIPPTAPGGRGAWETARAAALGRAP